MEYTKTPAPCDTCLAEPGGCGGECCHPSMERLRYFDGRLMVAKDFADEQWYFRSRLKTHYRYFEGSGIACGLEPECHPDESCRPYNIVVRKGLAIDCCGNQLYLANDTVIDLQPLIGEGEQTGQEWERFLCLRYCENNTEFLPSLYSDLACDELRREAGRIREGVELILQEPRDVSESCWPRDREDDSYKEKGLRTSDIDPDYWNPIKEHPGSTPDKNCTELRLHGRTPECPENICDCGGCVILARLTWTSEKGLVIDTTHRRIIPTKAQELTHIVHTNWEHGGTMTLSELAAEGWRLVVTFDGLIQEADGMKTGINEFTFSVQHRDAQQVTTVLPYNLDTPPTLEAGCKAVYSIARHFQGSALVNDTILITIYCDFVLDSNNLPVDGNFLYGVPRTGNKTPGGTFYSWVRIVADSAASA